MLHVVIDQRRVVLSDLNIVGLRRSICRWCGTWCACHGRRSTSRHRQHTRRPLQHASAACACGHRVGEDERAIANLSSAIIFLKVVVVVLGNGWQTHESVTRNGRHKCTGRRVHDRMRNWQQANAWQHHLQNHLQGQQEALQTDRQPQGHPQRQRART